MDTKEIKKLKKEAIEHLEIILSNDDLVDKLDKEDFLKIVKDHLSLIMQINSILNNKNDDLHDLIDKFNIFLKNKITNIQASNYSDENEMKDDLNYLKIYVKNTFNRDFETYSLNKDKLKKIESLDNTIPNTKNQESFSNENNSYNYFDNNQNQFNNMNNPYGNPEIIKQQFITQAIVTRITDDYRKGNYYFYQTKPKIIPIFKKIAAIWLLIASLVLFAIIGMQITISNMEIIGAVTDQGQKLYYNWNWFNYMFPILTAGLLCYFAYILFKPIYNDNYKYGIERGYNFTYYLLFIIGLLNITTIVYGFTDLEQVKILNESYQEKISIFSAFTYLNIVSVCINVSFIMFPIIYNVFKPTRNADLEKMLYEKYKKEIEDLGILK